MSCSASRLLARRLFSSTTMSSSPTTRRVALRGDFILDEPEFNKGTAFSKEERQQFGLVSRLPAMVNTLDEQCERAYHQLQSEEDPLKKNSFLWSLQAQNWVLFYELITRHLTELFPIIYTPTEAQAIAKYSHLFRRPMGGIFLSFPNQDTLEEDFKSHLKDAKGRDKQIDLVVISDGEAILGIGDQGIGGVAISSAKAVIYTLASGIDPSRILTIGLDVGTDNEKILQDDLYVGWREKRVRGDEYYAFVEKVVNVVKKEVGDGTLIHFEDFGVTNAQTLLDKYKDTHAIFNDDVQGTGAVTLAALQSAIQVTKSPLSEQKVLIYGAGSAGLGIARQIRDAMTMEDSDGKSISKEDATKRFYLVDKQGLLVKGDDSIRESLKEFARDDWEGEDDEKKKDLEEVVKWAKPTVMIGTSTNPGAFNEKVIKAMAKNTDRPIIFPLSNPTELCECQPKDANDWTDGKALLATGSPFDPVEQPDGSKYVIAECNNALIYPGIGFGAIVAQAKTVSDKMIVAATKALAKLSPALKDPNASLLPDFEDTRAVNFEIALAVWGAAIEDGVARNVVDESERKAFAEKKMWKPSYPKFIYDEEGDL